MEIDTLVYGVNNVQTMKPTMVGFLFGSFLLTELEHDVILKAKLNTREHSMKVFVYFNLHKKVFSVRAMEGENKGRVIAHTTTVELRDAVFKVSQAGRERVLKEKRKNVHAGVQGQWVAWSGDNVDDLDAVTYNPYRYDSFVTVADQTPVRTAARAVLNNRKIQAQLTI